MAQRVSPIVIKNPQILGGRATFRGTRVQAEILFENLAEGYSVGEIIDNFPTLDRDDVRAAIRQACVLLIEAAPTEAPAAEAVHASVL